MTNIERLDRCADIMRRRWIYDPELGLLFSRETKGPVKGGMTNKGHLVVSIQEGDFKVTLTYQKACYVYAFGAYDETLYEVHHINLNKQDNRLKNIRLMTKEMHRRIHKNVRKIAQLGHTYWLQPEAIEQSL
ncbi:TPA: HNH endonuclease [Escherichia coli]|nr:HNH endonuclease [Escherichia coli]